MSAYPYVKYSVRRLIIVRQLVTAHYMTELSDFETESEAHDFWEMVFVDRGQVRLKSDGATMALNEDELAFHHPNQEHSLIIQSEPATVFILSFACLSDLMDRFKNRVFRVSEPQKRLLSRMIGELKHAFLPDDTSQLMLRDIWPNPASPLGAEQMVVNYLEQLLIQLARGMEDKRPAIVEHAMDGRAVGMMKAYINSHLNSPLNTTIIAEHARYSRAYASEIFTASTGMGMMQYAANKRIELAKRLLCSGKLTITEISEETGFASTHYFSRRFKQLTGLTPSQYLRSLESKLKEL